MYTSRGLPAQHLSRLTHAGNIACNGGDSLKELLGQGFVHSIVRFMSGASSTSGTTVLETGVWALCNFFEGTVKLEPKLGTFHHLFLNLGTSTNLSSQPDLSTQRNPTAPGEDYFHLLRQALPLLTRLLKFPVGFQGALRFQSEEFNEGIIKDACRAISHLMRDGTNEQVQGERQPVSHSVT